MQVSKIQVVQIVVANQVQLEQEQQEHQGVHNNKHKIQAALGSRIHNIRI